MKPVRFINGLILLLAVTSCREEAHPFHDSTNWEMDRTISSLVEILETQNALLEQLHAATPIPPSIAMDLWSLTVDESEIGFECWVRLMRAPKLVPGFCQSISSHLLPLESRRDQLIERYSEHDVFFLQSIAPGFDALNTVGPRLQSHGVKALLQRCDSADGYRRKEWP